MIKITKEKKSNTKQNFYLISEKEWISKKSEFPNADLFFHGKLDEVFVYINDNSINFLIGMGDSPKAYEVQSAGQKLSSGYKKNINACPTSIHSNLKNELNEAFINGLFLGSYCYPFEKSHPVWHDSFELYLENINDSDQLSLMIKALCNGQFAGMDWLNKPANHKKVEALSEFLNNTAKKYNLKYRVYNHQECQKIGLGAFLAVNQGSAQEAAFTILEYHSDNPKAKTIGLVGKCVLFDTGGISIKSAENMHYMKSDMGGAAAVIGTLIAAAEMKLSTNIIAVLPITDNVISENAYLPSDVVKAYNGKTIEILNTDAEGRLTLADGLSYLSKNYKTDILIDLATLTGSAVRMFGYSCAPYFTNNQELKTLLEEAASKTNQKIWNLPLWNEWKEEIQSDVADFKNISPKPFGDCIVAAKFLEQFIENHPKWAHLDIAGVAYGNMPYAKDKAATGFGVQLLLDLIQNI